MNALRLQAIAARAGALTVLVLSHWGHPLNADEGVVLNAAWKLFHGQKLYQDFFEYVAPGTMQFMGMIFNIFGPSYLAAKISAVLVLGSSGYGVYKIGRLFLTERQSEWAGWAWLVFASIGYPVINHNTLSSALAVWVLYGWFQAAERPTVTRYGIVGMLTGGVYLFLQTKGIALAVAGILLVGYQRARKETPPHRGVSFIGGILVPIGVGALYWGKEIVTAVWSMRHAYSAYNVWSSVPLAGYLCISAAVLGWSFARIREKRKQIVVLSVFHGALVGASLTLPDLPHLALTTFPLILCVAAAAEVYGKKNRRRVISVAAQGIIALTVLGMVASAFMFSREQSKATAQLVGDIRRLVGEAEVIAWPFLPGLYFELGKKNPYPVSVSESLSGRPGMESLMLQVMQRENPRYAITNYPAVEKFRYTPNEIDKYISAQYHEVSSYGNRISVLEKNP